jgi:hypothetical protein
VDGTGGSWWSGMVVWSRCMGQEGVSVVVWLYGVGVWDRRCMGQEGN